MTTQADSPATRKWTPPEQGARVDVDLDEKDPSKAIARVEGKQNDLPDKEDSELDPEAKFLNRSRAVKKRIARIQRQFNQQIAERDAEHQREISSLRDQMNGLAARKTEGVAPDDAAHEREISALQAELEAAHEAGESKKVAALTAKINRLEGEYWHKKTVAQLGAQKQQQDKEEATRRQQQQERAATRKEDGPTPEAAKWMKANADWWDDPDFVGEKAYANAIHAQMVDEEDSDPDSEEHFIELTKRVKKKFKELEIVTPGKRRARPAEDDDDDLEDNARARRAPVVNVDRGRDVPRRGRTQTLTTSDVENMKKFGLDPNSEKHLVHYAKEKQAIEQAGT